MPHNIDTMAYYGRVPWHGLGTEIPKAARSDEMIVAAGLNWQVRMAPVPGARPDRYGRPLKYQLLRQGRDPSEPDIQLGLVSPRYEPLQNEDAFRFFDELVGSQAAMFHTAGALGDGERVWVLAKLPEPIRVAGDDTVDRFLLLSNAHNGQESVSIKFTPIRVVCQNTLNLALRLGDKPVRVRHSSGMEGRLQDVPRLLGIVHSAFASAALTFQMLARVRLNHARMRAFLEAVYPPTPKQKEKSHMPEVWQRVIELFESKEDKFAMARGTLWGAYNAVTYYEDYRVSTEATLDRRLDRIWFGASAEIKVRALKTAEEMALQWSHQLPLL